MNIKSARWLTLVVAGMFACGGHNNGNTGDDGGTGTSDAPSGGADANTGSGCGLQTCASAGAQCGMISDGCSGTIDCGSCGSGETCGGGGVHFQCGSGGGGGSGSGTCMPRTCMSAGADCGIISDGCGSAIACGSGCPTGEVCGATTANVCGAANQCTAGFCLDQMACNGSGQTPTVIKGVVTAPGHDDTATWGNPDPIYGALVYVPTGTAGMGPTYGVQPFASGVSCDTCSSEVTGDPMISVVTGTDGSFQITNAPCGVDVPLVIQLGRWRRMITVPAVQCCATTTLTNTQTHLPRTHTGVTGDLYSDIPLIAVSTGNADALHCVLRQIGVDDGEFTDPSGSGRVHFYQDNGAEIDGSTPAASTLYGSAAELAKYDMTLFECVGGEQDKSQTNQNNVINYANAGGRVFTTHYGYVWLTQGSKSGGNAAPWNQTAAWQINQSDPNDLTAFIDTTLQSDAGTQTRRIAFANWLKGVGASTTLGQIPVKVVRHDFNSVTTTPGTMSGTPAQQWVTKKVTNNVFTQPLHYTFDTPIAYSPAPTPTTQCGRVLYSDFHVTDASVSTSTQYPTECPAGKMNAQQKTFEFMLFDLASCVGTQTVTCQPKTCQDLGYDCGQSGDGCDDGQILDCGSCATGQTCGGGGTSGQCGMGMTMCTPLTCADVGAQCGIIGDGCGSTVDCGNCMNGQICGGNGVANQCGGGIQ